MTDLIRKARESEYVRARLIDQTADEILVAIKSELRRRSS